MRGRRCEKTGGVSLEYVEDFFGPRTTQVLEWYYSDRLLGKRKIRKKSRMLAPARDPKMKTVRRASIQVHEYQKLNNAMWTDPIGPSLRRQCLLRCFSWVLSSVSD